MGNPYFGMELSELQAAMDERAHILRNPPPQPRTPEQRVWLSQDTGHMLAIASRHLGGGQDTPGTPERALLGRPQDFVGAFSAFYRHERAGARHRTLTRAANAALGAGAQTWTRDALIDGERVYDLAMGSDAGLLQVLQQLQQLASQPKR